MDCIGTLFVIALVGWLPLHFCGKSILYNRETRQIVQYDARSYAVTCHYFNSTGTEETLKITGYPDNYYCPRLKDLGA